MSELWDWLADHLGSIAIVAAWLGVAGVFALAFLNPFGV